MLRIGVSGVRCCSLKFAGKQLTNEGDRPVRTAAMRARRVLESSCLGVQLKVGGIPHLRLNTATRPIANKYREGKLKRTLKREFKRT